MNEVIYFFPFKIQFSGFSLLFSRHFLRPTATNHSEEKNVKEFNPYYLIMLMRFLAILEYIFRLNSSNFELYQQIITEPYRKTYLIYIIFTFKIELYLISIVVRNRLL